MADPITTGIMAQGAVPVIAGSGAAAAMAAAVVAAAPVLIPAAIIVGIFVAVSDAEEKKA